MDVVRNAGMEREVFGDPYEDYEEPEPPELDLTPEGAD